MTTLERERAFGSIYFTTISSLWHHGVLRDFPPFQQNLLLVPLLHTSVSSKAFWDFPHHENPIRMEISHIFDGCWVALKSLARNTPFREQIETKTKSLMSGQIAYLNVFRRVCKLLILTFFPANYDCEARSAEESKHCFNHQRHSWMNSI